MRQAPTAAPGRLFHTCGVPIVFLDVVAFVLFGVGGQISKSNVVATCPLLSAEPPTNLNN